MESLYTKTHKKLSQGMFFEFKQKSRLQKSNVLDAFVKHLTIDSDNCHSHEELSTSFQLLEYQMVRVVGKI